MLLHGHEREFLANWAYPMMCATAGAVTETDFDEFVRTYARHMGWRGKAGLYQSLFADSGRTKALAQAHPLLVPVLTVDAMSYPVTEQTFRQTGAADVTAVRLENVGHLVAQEAPDSLASAILEFTMRIDPS